MKSFRKVLPIMLVVVMVFALVLSGCGKSAAPSTTTTSSTGSSAQATKAEEKIKMTLFMGNSGLATPDGVDESDNEWINIIEKYANVDLQVEMPGYQDYATKLNLLLSSGNLPDLVHSWVKADTYKRAEEGAFIDIKKYYDNSALIKKYITPEMMELTKDSVTGKYYRIPMAYYKGPQGASIEARWDLVSKYNNGQWPTSVDEWLNTFRAEKKAEPDSIPLSNRTVGATIFAYGGTPIFVWYGAQPGGSRYDLDTGKVVSTFLLPEYKAATLVMKQMYDEGVLDKEFATNDLNKWGDRWANKGTMVQTNSVDQYTPNNQVNARAGNPDPKTKTWETLAAPFLKTYPAGVDKRYTVDNPYQGMPITDHGLYISASCKNQDRAFKVIEGFASDELYQAIFWGKEGETYKVENGKRIPDAAKLADPKRYFSLRYGLVFGFVDGQDVKLAIGEQGVGKEYSDKIWSTIKPIDTKARENGLSPLSFVISSDQAKKVGGDAFAFINTATVDLIMGKETPAQFDAKVAEYKKTYGFMDDEATKWIADNKADLAKKGVKIPLK